MIVAVDDAGRDGMAAHCASGEAEALDQVSMTWSVLVINRSDRAVIGTCTGNSAKSACAVAQE